MDAKGWLKCDSPRKLLTAAKGKVSDRQLRLLSCALARMQWHKMKPGQREEVLAAERYLDDPEHEDLPRGRGIMELSLDSISELADACQHLDAWESASRALSAIRLKKDLAVPLIRCLFGNPFHPLKVEPAWLAANEAAVISLARSIAETADHSRLPILADALEEAGCTDEDLLSHLRSGQRHANNCWVLEALLVAGGSSPPRLLNWPEGPRGHPDWPRSQIMREKPCPHCGRSGPRTSHLLPGHTEEGNVFIRCVLCDHIEWVTTDGLGDEQEATRQAMEIVTANRPD